MSLQPAPHPASVFRYMKQALRDYLASDKAALITVNTPAGQAASAALVASGTFLADVNVPQPVSITVAFQQGGTNKGVRSATPDAAGNWTTTFPANTCVAGSALIIADNPYAAAVSSPAITLT